MSLVDYANLFAGAIMSAGLTLYFVEKIGRKVRRARERQAYWARWIERGVVPDTAAPAPAPDQD